MEERASPKARVVTGAEISVFAHATEDEEKVERALRNTIPAEITGYKIDIQRLKGHYKDPITVITAHIRKKAAGEVFCATLRTLSSLDQHQLLDEVEDRSDKAGSLYLRLDKQAAFRGVGRLSLVDPIRMKFRFQIPHGMDPVAFIRSSIATILDETKIISSNED